MLAEFEELEELEEELEELFFDADAAGGSGFDAEAAWVHLRLHLFVLFFAEAPVSMTSVPAASTSTTRFRADLRTRSSRRRFSRASGSIVASSVNLSFSSCSSSGTCEASRSRTNLPHFFMWSERVA